MSSNYSDHQTAAFGADNASAQLLGSWNRPADLSGGCTSVSITRERAPELMHAPPPAGVQATNYGSSNQVEIGQPNAERAALSVVATAMTPWGRSMAPSEIKGDSVVTIGNQQMSARVAERLGFLSRDAGGFYRDVSTATPTHAPEAPAAAPQEVSEAYQYEALPDSRAESIRDAMSRSVQPGALIRASMEFIESGEVSGHSVSAIASQMGIHADEARQHLQRVQNSFMAQGAAALEKASGLPGEFAATLLQEHYPQEYKRAAHHMWVNGSTSLLRDLAVKAQSRFIDEVANGSVAADQINVSDGSAMTIWRQGNTVLIDVPGAGTMPLKAAIKAGLVVVGQK